MSLQKYEIIFKFFVNCPILNKFGVSRQIVEKVPNLRFLENNFGGSALMHTDRRTGGHGEAYRRFLQVGEGAQK